MADTKYTRDYIADVIKNMIINDNPKNLSYINDNMGNVIINYVTQDNKLLQKKYVVSND